MNTFSLPTRFFPGKDVLENKDQVLANLNEQGYDAVITMSLLHKARNDKWVAESYTGGYYDYHRNFMMDYYNDGYYVEGTKYYIITNVFSIKSDKLIWSATTVTPDPPSLQQGVDEILRTVVVQMKKDGFLPGKKK